MDTVFTLGSIRYNRVLERMIVLLRLITGNKRILTILVSVAAFSVVFLGGILSANLAGAKDEGDIVAVINGLPITREEFYTRMEEEIGEQMMNQLIAETLVLSVKDVEVTDEEIQAEIEAIKANYPGDEYFQQVLAQYGLTMERLTREVRINLILQKLAEAEVTITDEEIRAYFEQNKADLNTPKQVRSSHILVDSLETANKLIAELEAGADFAVLAQQWSKDTGSAVQGGDIGYITFDDPIVPEYLDAVFSLKVGEISAPVKTQYGYHIIKVTDIIEAKEAVLDEQIDNIRSILVQQKSRPYSDIVNDLYLKADMVINWERYKVFENK